MAGGDDYRHKGSCGEKRCDYGLSARRKLHLSIRANRLAKPVDEIRHDKTSLRDGINWSMELTEKCCRVILTEITP